MLPLHVYGTDRKDIISILVIVVRMVSTDRTLGQLNYIPLREILR